MGRSASKSAGQSGSQQVTRRGGALCPCGPLGEGADHGHDRAPDRAHVDHVAAAGDGAGDGVRYLGGPGGKRRGQIHAVGHAGRDEAGQDGDDMHALAREPVPQALRMDRQLGLG